MELIRRTGSGCPQMAPPRCVDTVESPDSCAARDRVGASGGKTSQHAEERACLRALK